MVWKETVSASMLGDNESLHLGPHRGLQVRTVRTYIVGFFLRTLIQSWNAPIIRSSFHKKLLEILVWSIGELMLEYFGFHKDIFAAITTNTV